MTKQEQIKAIKQIIDERVETTLGQVQGRHGNVIKTVDTVIIARDIVNAGYGEVSEYKAEIERLKDENCELTKKLAKQTRIARDANAKFTGVEHYLKPFQYKADRLQTKCDDLKKLSDWQREEIKRLKAEVNKGCDNCETIKQGQVDVLKELKNRIYDISPYNPLVSKDNVKYSIDKLIKEIENDK